MLALSKCIARIASLRELVVTDGYPRDSMQPILRALKANGNIRSVAFGSCKSNPDEILAQAYCTRNECLDGLLLESTRGSEEDDQTILAENQKMKQCPALLQATQQIPSTKSSKVLRTLMRFRVSIG